SSGGGNASAGAAAKPSAQPTPAPKIGDTITKGNWAYTVTKVDKPGKSITVNQFSKLDALGTWVAVYMNLKNVGTQNFGINSFDFELLDSSGVKSNVTDNISYYSWLDSQKMQTLAGQKPPGIPFDTALLFDVNPDAKGFKLNIKQANVAVDLGI
ncbi:MAG: DUF4352 domain-containing protein, partial [Chloroflexota bacterium]|nr:DUF4352 domain-containing protein [Chloroflexota bacterium]